MATKQENALHDRSAMMHVLSKHAAKEADRDRLTPGESVEVELHVSGTVGKRQVLEEIRGRLNVGHDSTVNSSIGPAAGDLLAIVLDRLPAKERLKLMEELPRQFLQNGHKLPEADPETQAAAERMLERLRAAKETTRRGTVSFAVAKAA